MNLNLYNKQLFFSKLIKKFLFSFDNEFQELEIALVLGCGPQVSITIPDRIKTVGLDIVFKDLIISRKRQIYDKYICCDAINLCFKPKSFDLVIATHLIEHLKKDDAMRILDELENVARKKILIGVPNGGGIFGSYEWYGSIHIGHQSQWRKEDFLRKGYWVKGVDGLKIVPRKFAINVEYRKKKWVRRLLQLCEFITTPFPEFAYNLICIKRLT